MATLEPDDPSPALLAPRRIDGRLDWTLVALGSFLAAVEAEELSVIDRSLLNFGTPRVAGSPRRPSGILPFGVSDGCSTKALPA